MNFLQHVVSIAWKKSGEVASSLQRQAPGARMIGEFAVKQASKEAEKVAHRIREMHSSCRPK
jgi:hypothetical protein